MSHHKSREGRIRCSMTLKRMEITQLTLGHLAATGMEPEFVAKRAVDIADAVIKRLGIDEEIVKHVDIDMKIEAEQEKEYKRLKEAGEQVINAHLHAAMQK
jgi:hypothetical protein